jgi:hypothetical protein
MELFVMYHHTELESSFRFVFNVAILTECECVLNKLQTSSICPKLHNSSGRDLVLADCKGHLAILSWSCRLHCIFHDRIA